jgi:hypothetical protein
MGSGFGAEAVGPVPSARAGALPPVSGRARLAVNVSVGILLTTLVVDGFPPGIDLLREFGSRLTNFFLLLCGLVLVVYGRMRAQPLSVSRRDSLLWIIVVVVVPLSNIPIAVLQAGAGAQAVLVDWLKQYLMFFWGLLSFFIWRGTFSGFGARRYCALATATSLVPVVLFFLEYIDPSTTVTSVLDLFRLKLDPRPSSLATEPAIYAAWISMIWPLVFYSARNAKRALRRVAAACVLMMMVGTAYLSNARTFSVIMVLQLIYLGYWAIQRRQSWRSRVRSFLIILCMGAVIVVVLLSSLLSLVRVSENASDVARFAYTITGINVFLAHPLVGVGIGQFSNFFAQFVPQFAAVSDEVMTHVSGVALYRASTFNLFVRLFVEFGIPFGTILSLIIVRPIIRAPKSPIADPFVIYAALSAVGGAGFWLSQDAYGYQPGILSLAILSLVLQGSMRTASESPVSRPGAPADGDAS